MKCELRPLEEKDLPTTFTWRNDEEILRTALSPQPVSWNEHEAMFKYNNALKLIFEVDGVPSGYVSMSRDPDTPTGFWGFHMAPSAKGKGLSEIMLKMALIYIKKEGFQAIEAEVRPNNFASMYLHKKLKFNEIPDYTKQFKRYMLVL